MRGEYDGEDYDSPRIREPHIRWRFCKLRRRPTVQFAADADKAVNTKALKETGIIVLAPSPSLKSGMAKIGSVIAKEWATSAGADGEAMLAAYRM